jgi:large subunit ribosomal protein L6
MSRIGRSPIELPAGVSVSISPGRVMVNGPLGELAQDVPQRMTIAQDDGMITVTRPTDRGEDRALHGLTRSLVANMVEGVTKGFEKRLEIQGVGYRASMRGTALELNVGFSHPVVKGRACRNHLRGADPDRDRGQGDRQAAGGPDCRRNPQGPPPRAVQGQGHPLRG